MKNKLINEAKLAREEAYAPYSLFKVGASLLTSSGNIYKGCNIENASFPLTCCAERTAIFNAVSNGEREFSQMAIIADTKGPISPCGACRQVMAEFFSDDVTIYLSNLFNETVETTINELLPFTFKLWGKNLLKEGFV